MNRRRHPLLPKPRCQQIAVIVHDRILGEDARAARSLDYPANPPLVEQCVVPVSDRGPPRDLPVKALEFRKHDCALDRIHPPADSDPSVVIAAGLAVHPDFAEGRGQRLIVGEHRAAVSVTAERLGREEAGAADRREVAALAALIIGAEALRGILDHG